MSREGEFDISIGCNNGVVHNLGAGITVASIAAADRTIGIKNIVRKNNHIVVRMCLNNYIGPCIDTATWAKLKIHHQKIKTASRKVAIGIIDLAGLVHTLDIRKARQRKIRIKRAGIA